MDKSVLCGNEFKLPPPCLLRSLSSCERGISFACDPFPIDLEIVAADQSVDIYVLTKTALLCTLLVFQVMHPIAFHVVNRLLDGPFVRRIDLGQYLRSVCDDTDPSRCLLCDCFPHIVPKLLECEYVIQNNYFDSEIAPFEYGILAYAVVLQLFFFVVAYPLHREHRWSFYRKVGVDPIFRHMYSAYLRFKAVLKVGSSHFAFMTLLNLISDFMIVLLNLLCISSVPLKSQWLITLFVTGLLLAAGFFAVGMIGVCFCLP